MNINIRPEIEAIRDDIIATRRHIHKHPEIGFEVHETARLVSERLTALGIKVTTGVGRTGVVGLLKWGSSGPCIGLRADMDALPIQETSNLLFKSVNDDVKLEGIWISMTLKKEYRGMQVKTNLVYLHSWGTGSAVSTAGSIILPFALYYAPAGLNLAASITWAAADIFIFQKFDGSWKKTKTETLTLYPSGNLPPCWNGICPTSVGGSAGGLD